MFVACKKCGKRIIERLPNGIWIFKFGKSEKRGHSVVDMKIHGSIQLRCLRRGCDHINILHFFPNANNPQGTETEIETK